MLAKDLIENSINPDYGTVEDVVALRSLTKRINEMTGRDMIDNLLESTRKKLEEAVLTLRTKLSELRSEFLENPFRAGIRLRVLLIEKLESRRGDKISRQVIDELIWLFVDGLAMSAPSRGQSRDLDGDMTLQELFKGFDKSYRPKGLSDLGVKLRRFLSDGEETTRTNIDMKDLIRGLSTGDDSHNEKLRDGDRNWIIAVARDNRKSSKGQGFYTDRSQHKEVHEMVKRFGVKSDDIISLGYDDITIMLPGWDRDEVQKLLNYLNDNLPEAPDGYKDEHNHPDGFHNAVAMLYPDNDEEYEDLPGEYIY